MHGHTWNRSYFPPIIISGIGNGSIISLSCKYSDIQNIKCFITLFRKQNGVNSCVNTRNLLTGWSSPILSQHLFFSLSFILGSSLFATLIAASILFFNSPRSVSNVNHISVGDDRSNTITNDIVLKEKNFFKNTVQACNLQLLFYLRIMDLKCFLRLTARNPCWLVYQ